MHLRLSWRSVADSRLAEMSRIVDEFVVGPTNGGNLNRPELQQMINEERVFLIDVRPSIEFSNRHLPGAVSLPLKALPPRLDELPRDRKIAAYCLFADEAVEMPRRRGFDADLLDGG